MTTKPLTMIEKILAHHAMGEVSIEPGNFICVNVDWTMASEASWFGMYQTYKKLGNPGVHRNDRIWLAVDHIADPRINHMDKPKMLIKTAEAGVKELGIVDYQPPNTTIMHTEFYKERAQPGMIIIGSDSHTCSSGGLGALAVGLGAADVVFPMVTGETFFQVPEIVRIEFINKPKFGISGKDVILHILGEFKRNTIAGNRAVEYTGDGIQYLSCDARFAIANMSTEFGAIAGVFVPDQQTAAFIQRRSNSIHRNEALFFRPDKDAHYAETKIIDLSEIAPNLALYPSPDNVVPVKEKIGMELDGCFIGACTTTEEDLIIAALLLKEGLENGLTPVPNKKRKVTPGSIQTIARLRSLDLLKWYEMANFEVGAPGCSYCVGMGADQAGEGEVWLSSQNRNFKNRMGRGSIGNICSAATVAASSFSMTVCDPQPLLDKIDIDYFDSVRSYWKNFNDAEAKSILYSEPKQKLTPISISGAYETETSCLPEFISSKVQRFGNDVDTDAIIPIDKCTSESEEELGRGAFAYVRPEFVSKVAKGSAIIVAGRGFGSGSSREAAPRALKGCGIKAVIAKSYAYIYGRNQANFALFGIIVSDDRFYDLAQEDSTVEIQIKERKVIVHNQSFPFKLDVVEERIQAMGGIEKRWKTHGKDIFRKLQKEVSDIKSGCPDDPSSVGSCGDNSAVLSW
ncbi:3-isopropylmalate dehydratase [Backusella circina FSU 941]|nr:3-isopropylmalate dehydratase [Backusella circina FSU 941]